MAKPKTKKVPAPQSPEVGYEPSVSLPNWDEAEKAWYDGTSNDLEAFLFHWEPSYDSKKGRNWREDLSKALDHAYALGLTEGSRLTSGPVVDPRIKASKVAARGVVVLDFSDPKRVKAIVAEYARKWKLEKLEVYEPNSPAHRSSRSGSSTRCRSAATS